MTYCAGHHAGNDRCPACVLLRRLRCRRLAGHWRDPAARRSPIPCGTGAHDAGRQSRTYRALLASRMAHGAYGERLLVRAVRWAGLAADDGSSEPQERLRFGEHADPTRSNFGLETSGGQADFLAAQLSFGELVLSRPRAEPDHFLARCR